MLEKKSFQAFSIASRPILVCPGTNHCCMKGIQVFSNKGPDCLLRGDNKNTERDHIKIYLRKLAPELFRTTVQDAMIHIGALILHTSY
jgi:hypothetical protein